MTKGCGVSRTPDYFQSGRYTRSNAVPRRFGDSGDAWHLLFASALHGRSLAHLLHLAASAGPVLLLIRDRAGHLFGAFLSELREPHLVHA